MKLKGMVVMALACAMVFSLVTFGEAAKYEFKLGHAVSDQHPYHLGA